MNKLLEHRREIAGETLTRFLGELVQVYDQVHGSQDHLGGLPYSRNDEIFDEYLAANPDVSLSTLVDEKRVDDLARIFLREPNALTENLVRFRMNTAVLENPNALHGFLAKAASEEIEAVWPESYHGDGWDIGFPEPWAEYFFDQFREAKLSDPPIFNIRSCPGEIALVGIVTLEEYARLITGDIHLFSPGGEFVRLDVAAIFNVRRFWRYQDVSEFSQGIEAWKGFIEAFFRLSPCRELSA